MSINPDGTVAGFFQDTDWLTHGFSRSPDGRFKTFDVRGAGTVVGTWEGTLCLGDEQRDMIRHMGYLS
jgi:hypothetical protein